MREREMKMMGCGGLRAFTCTMVVNGVLSIAAPMSNTIFLSFVVDRMRLLRNTLHLSFGPCHDFPSCILYVSLVMKFTKASPCSMSMFIAQRAELL